MIPKYAESWLRNYGFEIQIRMNMENAIFKQIVMYIDEHDILNQDETCEQMPVFHVLSELECLSSFINKDYYISFCVNMAIMYVNQGILYAKSKLSVAEFENYIIYFDVCINKDNVEDYVTVDVVFSRKAKEHFFTLKESVNVEKTKIYKFIENTVGINDFSCYYCKNEYEDEYYSFVPKMLEVNYR